MKKEREVELRVDVCEQDLVKFLSRILQTSRNRSSEKWE